MIALQDQDIPTRFSSGFILKWIIPRVEPGRFLFGEMDRRLAFTSLASAPDDYLIIVGHGQHASITGQHDEVLLEVGNYNPNIVTNRFVKFLSCQTGETLGPDMIQKGAKAYQGYKEDYLWIADEEYKTHPWDDPIASKWLLPVVDAIDAMLSGSTNKAVYEMEREAYRVNADKETDELSRSLLTYAYSNLMILGDPEATVRPRMKSPFGFLPLPRILFPVESSS